MPKEGLFDNEQLALTVGQNLTAVCHILESTAELLDDLTDTPEESRVALRKALADVLKLVNDELMEDLFIKQPCFQRLQRRNIEFELEREKKSPALTEELNPQNMLVFETNMPQY